MSQQRIKVWDIAVRIFHWSLVGAFIVAFATGDEVMPLHVWAGYLIAGLLVFRLFWGFIGTRHARFSDFVYRPRKVLTYLREVFSFRAKRYLGHNPAGGAMIILMLVMLSLTVFTGVVTYGAEEGAGPLAAWTAGWSHGAGEAFEEAHEFFANATILLVVFHVLGVVFESLLHHENLVRSMWNGYKRRDQE